MNILSLFDGISCGQLALKRAGLNIKNYYASEIDKYAKSITQYNFPNTIQLGDVRNVKGESLPPIDLLMGGSPCQGFSFAGKQLNFEDERSKLFFEFVRLMKECRPRYFLLENVKMKKEYQDVISRLLGVEPVEINSALVSAQNRKRLYWTNIKDVKQPKDKGILLKDILEDGSNKIGAFRGRYLKDGKRQDHKIKTAGLTTQRLEIRNDNKSNILTTVQKDNVVLYTRPHGYIKENLKTYDKYPCLVGQDPSTKYLIIDLDKLKLSEKANQYMSRLRNGKPRWEYHTNPINGKAACLTANMWKGVPYGVIKEYNRKLHVIECERLQTIPDNYTAKGINDKDQKVKISNTQRYKAIGNGWTVDVIAHILKGLK